MFTARRCLVSLAVLLAASSAADAAFVTFGDKAAFLAATGAADATGPLPTTGLTGPLFPPGYTETPITAGSITYISARFLINDLSPRLPGNEYAISFGITGRSNEDLDLVPAAPVFSLGFDFVEPQFDPNVNGPFVDSTFEVTLRSGGSSVGSFTFNAPNDTAAFVGVWSSVAFDRVLIREIIGGDGNEFFGRVYTGTAPLPAAVPEPASVGLVAAGAAGLVGYAR
ncbi:MAG: hypothetical protein K2X87_08910, partial [Gemmataceae bacterium]|nr:hypothetical protein [Gemmataceae bacterium]